MTAYYCTSCWAEVSAVGGGRHCSRCGAALEATGDFVDKLINALGHPEPATPVRAATILSRLGDRRAVAPLLATLQTRNDGFLLAAAAKALGELGDQAAVPVLAEVLERGPVVARLAAAQALRQLGGPASESALRRAAVSDPTPAVREAASARP